MLSLSQRRQPFAVCTVVNAMGSVPGKVGATMIVTLQGRHAGTVGGAGLEERVKAAAVDALQGRGAGLHHFDLANWKPGGLDSVCGGSVDVSIVVHRPLPHLLLLGGGHCGKALADIVATLEWDVTVVDERPEYATRDRFPTAIGLHAGDPVTWTRDADLSDYSHAYLLGHKWDLDAEILTVLLPRFEGFTGVIGSQSKRVALEKHVLAQGVAKARWNAVRCPVGLSCGAESPEEIAVAIAAEVISTLKPSKRILPEATP